MPVFDFVFWSQPTGGFLEADGAIVQVEITIPTVLEEWCTRNNVAVPTPVSGYALIDTGASISSVHEPTLNQLGLLPIDSMPMQTPTNQPMNQGRYFVYAIRASFPGVGVTNYPMSRVVGSRLDWVTSQGKNVIMLIGRDLLKYFLVVYNGRCDAVTLAY